MRFRPRYRRRSFRFPGFWLLAAMAAAFIGVFSAGEKSSGPSNSIVAPPVQASLAGRATVIDGDTIEISGQRVRFNGVDAPERGQRCNDERGKSYRCGVDAARALDTFLAASRPTRCEFVERDDRGRFVGQCFRADGQSAASWLVSSGHALDWPRYSGGAYSSHQQEAEAAKRGIWRGTFDIPWEWRAARRNGEPTKPNSTPQALVAVPAAPAQGSGDCVIKGNVSPKGERIFHVPGQRNYDETRISARKGERWFCSEAEARQAGWRKARR